MRLLLIDGNSIVHASQHSTPLSHNGVFTHAIFGFLRTLQVTLRTNTDYAKPLILWDSNCQWRRDLYGDYKSNRESTPEKIEAKAQISQQRPSLVRGLGFLGIPQAAAPGFEADDLAGYFVRLACSKDGAVKLITGDEDWLQLVNSKVCWQDPRKGGTKKCSRVSFEDFTGYRDGVRFMMGKALQGDKSDNVPGAPGIGPKTAQSIIAHFGSLQAMMDQYRATGGFTKENLPALKSCVKKVNEVCEQHWDVVRRNVDLMNLLTAKRDEQIRSAVRLVSGPTLWNEFEQWCLSLGFNSIVATRTQWQNQFGSIDREISTS